MLGLAAVLPLGREASAAVMSVGCSTPELVDAIATANTNDSADVITLAERCVYILSAPLTIEADGYDGVESRRVTINARLAVLDGGGATRLLQVQTYADLVFNLGTVRNGKSGGGPGAVAVAGFFHSGHSHFHHNTGVDGTVQVLAGGRANFMRSAFWDNKVTSRGGAVYNAGVINVVNTTITRNESADVAPAIYDVGTTSLVHSTIVGNGAGPGALSYVAAGPTTLHLLSSILDNCSGDATTFDDQGTNISRGTGCGLTPKYGSMPGTAPLLEPFLSDPGAAVLSPGPGSPALRAALPAGCLSGSPTAGMDQRGAARREGSCDIGAAENRTMSSWPSELDFSTVIGSPLRGPVEIRTDGSQDPLVVSKPVLSGSSDFSIVGDSCSGRRLPTPHGCLIDLQYDPKTEGSDTASLTFYDNSSSEMRTVALQGAASAPAGTVPTPGASASASAPPTGVTAGPRSTGVAPAGGSSPSPGAPVASPGPVLSAGPPAVAGAPPSVSASRPPGSIQLAAPAEDAPRARRGGRAGVRPLFAASVRLPDETSTDLALVSANAFLAILLMLLLSFPMVVFNSTVEAHREDLSTRFRALQRLPRLGADQLARLPQGAAIAASCALGAVLYGWLDPGFGLDRASAVLVIGLAVGLLAVTAAYELPGIRFLRRRHGADCGRLQVFPGLALLALACVVLSRGIGLQPGLVLGTVAGFAALRELPTRDEARSVAVSGAVLATFCLASWLAWAPVADRAAGLDPSFLVLVLDTAFATVFVAGVEVLAFGFVPLRFLDGYAVFTWRKSVWLGLWFVGIFTFVHVLLHPSGGAEGFVGRERFLAALLAAYLIGAIAVSQWFVVQASRGGRTA